MKVKIKLLKGETIEQAKERLHKAFKPKKADDHIEQYHDDKLNEFHDYILKLHDAMLEAIANEVKDEIRRHAATHGYHK